MRRSSGLRTFVALLAAGGLAGGLGGTLTAPAQAVSTRAVPAPTTAVAPGALAAGDAPRVAWVHGKTLVQPALQRETGLSTGPGQLLHVKGGYVVTTTGDGVDSRLTFVSYAGKKRTLVKKTAYGPDLASADGRWFVLSSDPYATGVTRQQHLRVIRVSDGSTVAARTFPARSTVLAAGNGRILVHEARSTVSWNLAQHRVTTLARTKKAPKTAWDLGVKPPASFGAKTFVARSGAKDQIRRLSDSRKLWSTSKGEYVLSYSPDDRRVVTATRLHGSDQDAPWRMADELRVRNARTGRVLHTFTGHIGFETGVAPVWEDDVTLLLHATGEAVPVNEEGDVTYLDKSIVRCGVVSGACEIAKGLSTYENVVLLQRKSN